LGIPHFGVNRTTVRFQAPAPAKLSVTTCVRPRRGGRVIDPGGEVHLEPDGAGTFTGKLTWTTRHYDDANTLDLAVKDRETGQNLWRGAYDFSWEDGSLPLTYLYRGETGGDVPTPAPSDPDFLL
jgi:hypothetical protein